MKTSAILGIISALGATFKTASNVAPLAGTLYLIDCRMSEPVLPR